MSTTKEKLHPWNTQLACADILYVLITIILLKWFSHVAFYIVTLYVLLFPYLYFTKRKKAIPLLLVSLPISFVWVFLSRSFYQYNQDMVFLLGVNLYSLFAFSGGLGGVYIIYSHFEHLCGGNIWKQAALATFIFWIFLIGAETASYHFSEIKNEVTSEYPGLPFCDCIHAPKWMQLVYFLLGPFYFVVVKTLRIPNPHIIQR